MHLIWHAPHVVFRVWWHSLPSRATVPWHRGQHARQNEADFDIDEQGRFASAQVGEVPLQCICLWKIKYMSCICYVYTIHILTKIFWYVKYMLCIYTTWTYTRHILTFTWWHIHDEADFCLPYTQAVLDRFMSNMSASHDEQGRFASEQVSEVPLQWMCLSYTM